MTNHIENAVSHLKDIAVQRARIEAIETTNKAHKVLEAAGWDIKNAAPVPRDCWDPSWKTAKAKKAFLQQFVSYKHSNDIRNVAWNTDLVERFIRHAEENAADQYERFVAKLNNKIGEVTEADLEGDHVWGYSFLRVTKPDGTKECWKTHMIINVSKLGKMFNQFPTRKVKD